MKQYMVIDSNGFRSRNLVVGDIMLYQLYYENTKFKLFLEKQSHRVILIKPIIMLKDDTFAM